MCSTLKEVKERFDSFLKKHPKHGKLIKTVENCNPKHILLLSSNLANRNGPSYFRLAMEGYQNWEDTEKCTTLKSELIKKSLENVMAASTDMEEVNATKIVEIMLTFPNLLEDLPAINLLSLVECCANELESPNHKLNSCWLGVFAKLISLGSECPKMVVNSGDPGNIMDGKLWRTNLIRKICIDNL